MNHLLIMFLVVFSLACQSDTIQDIPKPNVLLIIADDHGYADWGDFGFADDVETPNINRIKDSGVAFVSAYATSPICSPSRIGLMTGSYHQRHGVYWYGGPGILKPGIPTIAEVLTENNYSTGLIGKFHYGSNDAEITHRSFPLNHGFQHLFGFNGGRKHYLIHNEEVEAQFRQKMELAESPKQSLRMGGFFQQNEKVNIEGFSTEILGEKARDFMKKNIDDDNPFFLTLSFNAVHNFTHQLPEDYLEEKGLNGYRDWDPESESYYEWYNNGRVPNNPEGRAHYLGQLHYLDLEVGKVLDFLKNENQLENTIVIYIGDNGGSTQIYANNAPFSGGKYTMYEGGLRVPLIISWPGKYESGQVSSRLVSAMDIFPTLCEALDIPVAFQVDGLSIHKLLTGENRNIQHPFLVWYGGQQAAVRYGKWKYRWADDREESYAKQSAAYEGVDLELGEFLYDLRTDYGETTNVADQEPEIFDSLIEVLDKWKMAVLPQEE